MTSISSTMPGFPMPPPPRARIDTRIAAAASAGTISQTDGTAMEAAVDAIGQSLRGGGSIAAGPGGTAVRTSGSGTSFKDKLDGLIDAQVTSGTLTDAQATELKGIFGQGAPSQGVRAQDADGDRDGGQVTATTGQTPAAGGAVHGHHHHGGGGGMAAIMAALDGSDSTDGSTDTSAIDALTGTTSTGATATPPASATSSIVAATTASSTVAVSAADTATRQLDKLIGFLEKMRESIGSAQTYGTGSANSSGTDAAGMVFSGIA